MGDWLRRTEEAGASGRCVPGQEPWNEGLQVLGIGSEPQYNAAMHEDPVYRRLHTSLAQLADTHQRRLRRCAEAISTTECVLDGRRCVSFATNDYLGLTRHPKVLRAFADAASERAGAGASPLISGRSRLHLQLEQKIAEFESAESAILFPSGFAANMGTLTALVGARDAVFCDRENHASLIDGCRASAGKFFVYDRTDLGRLAEAIERRRDQFDGVFLVTDTVFSMDGTLANLPQLCDIAETYNATVVVDEAHATGVFGALGRGVCELQDVEDRVGVRIGTLSKALGGLGGFVAGSNVLCEWLWNTARSQFFSTALPPAVCSAATAAFQVIQDEPARRYLLAKRSEFARQLLKESGFELIFDTLSPPGSPIIAVLMGEDERAVQVCGRLLEAGFFLPAVRPPTVAAGTARLRMSICCDHSEEQIRAAVYQLRDVMQSEP